MKVRLAILEDFDSIMTLYQVAKEYMKKEGNFTQWNDNYPSIELVKEDILKKICYVIEEKGKIHGVFSFFIGNESTYSKIYQGKWNHPIPYGVIHRIASDGIKHGIFALCVSFCKSQINYLRIDTHENNKTMQHLIEKYGFTYCGIIHLQNGDDRKAYDYFMSN